MHTLERFSALALQGAHRKPRSPERLFIVEHATCRFFLASLD